MAYATLEEAFGVASFLAPEPLALRGGVGRVKEARHKAFDAGIALQAAFPAPAVAEDPPPPPAPRAPLQIGRCPVADAYALGGAEAAWRGVPPHVRADMVWHALRATVDADFVAMLLLGIALFVLFRK